jgi:hypothetical protein
MYSTTELLRDSFIKGIAKTTASITVLGVVSFVYYLYNIIKDENQIISKKDTKYTKDIIDIQKKYGIDFAKVFNNKKDNGVMTEMLELVDVKNISGCDNAQTVDTVDTVETVETVDTVETEVNYIHDLDVFEKNRYEEKNNKNFKKLFDRL